MAGPSAAGPKKRGKKASGPPQPTEPAVEASAPALDAQQLTAVPAKKKRNPNPGIRVQGGRVYDSENGTTCHQCRQKTAETKAKCTHCTLYFCPKCLENRYQEKVEEVNARADGWRCPRCRGDCNCSNCRKKAGKEATGQLANIAKKAGFSSVKDLLEVNPNAKAIQLPRAPSAAPSSEGPADGGAGSGDAVGDVASGAGGEAAPQRRKPAKRKAVAAAAEAELVPDEELPPREGEMPDPQPLAARKAAGGGAVASKRPRGGLAWLADVPDEVALPGGRAGAELAVVLEFLQVFGARLQLRAPSLAALAAELLQPAAPGGGAPKRPLCPSPDESLVAAVHCKLLDVVRVYWNVRGATTAASWQGVMRGYFVAAQLSQAAALELRWAHGPPAVAGEIFARPPLPPNVAGSEALDEAEAADEVGEASRPDGGAEVAACGAAAAAEADYPEGGYWAVPPAVRVSMLHALVHDALECEELRKVVEEGMGDALDEEKERRQQLAGVRREARAAVARERDQQVALMIASAASGSLSLEEQQRLLEEARQRAEATASQAAAAKVRSLAEKVHPPTVRAAVLGADREGRRYLQLQAAPLLAGEGGLVVQTSGEEGPSDSGDGGDALHAYASASLAGLAAALHPRGRQEGPLQAALLRAFKLPAVEAQAAGGSAGDTGSAAEEGTSSQQAGKEGSVGPAAASEAAGVPPAQKLKAGGGQQRLSALGPPADPAAAVPADDATEPAKRARKPAGGRSQAGAAVRAKSDGSGAAEVASGGGAKRRRQSGDADASKRPRAPPGAPAVPAAGAAPRGRRTSPRSVGGAAGQAGGKAAAAKRDRALRGSRAETSQQLPLKVDDMLAEVPAS